MYTQINGKNAFFRDARRENITPEPYTRLLWKWSQNVRKTSKNKVPKSRRKKISRCEVITKNVEGGAESAPPPVFLGLS